MSENGNEMAGLYKKMAGVMGRLARVPKRGRNEFHKYDYATDGDVLDAVRHAMAEETLAFFVTLGKPEMGTVKTRSGDTPLFSLPLTITFADGETGATLSVNWIGQAMDGQDKGINKAATSGVKYCLLKTFLMSTGEDDPDAGDGKSGKKPQAKRKPKQKAAAPSPRQNGGTTKPKRPSFKTDVLGAVVAAGFAEDMPTAARRLGKTQVLTRNDDTQAIVLWAGMYSTHRDAKLSPDDAAARADAEWTAGVESAAEEFNGAITEGV